MTDQSKFEMRVALVLFALLAVAFTVLAIQFVSVVAERNDYLLLIRAYGLGCPQ